MCFKVRWQREERRIFSGREFQIAGVWYRNDRALTLFVWMTRGTCSRKYVSKFCKSSEEVFLQFWLLFWGAGRCPVKGRQRAIVSQRNFGTVSKATLGKLSERPGGAHMGFSERIDTILYLSELNWLLLHARERQRWRKVTCLVGLIPLRNSSLIEVYHRR